MSPLQQKDIMKLSRNPQHSMGEMSAKSIIALLPDNQQHRDSFVNNLLLSATPTELNNIAKQLNELAAAIKIANL